MRGNVDIITRSGCECAPVEPGATVRLWASPDVYYNVRVLTDGSLRVEGRNSCGTDELTILPRCANAVEIMLRDALDNPANP